MDRARGRVDEQKPNAIKSKTSIDQSEEINLTDSSSRAPGKDWISDWIASAEPPSDNPIGTAECLPNDSDPTASATVPENMESNSISKSRVSPTNPGSHWSNAAENSLKMSRKTCCHHQIWFLRYVGSGSFRTYFGLNSLRISFTHRP